MKQLLYAACIIALCPTAVFAQGICDPSGNIIIFSNYDGGTLNLEIDEDIPNLRIGICSYESVTVNISGDYSENVEEVVYAGYDADDVSAVTGVPPAIVEILVIPPATLDDPDGYPYIICAYECDTDYVPGGCNTVEQVTDFFSPNSAARSGTAIYNMRNGRVRSISAMAVTAVTMEWKTPPWRMWVLPQLQLPFPGAG